MALADDDPYVEQLLEDASARTTAPLSRRELRTDAGLGALLLVAVVALAVLAPSARALSPLGAIGAHRRLRARPAASSSTSAPATRSRASSCSCRCCCSRRPRSSRCSSRPSFLVGRLPSYLRGAVHPTRLVFVLADAVYAVGPAVVVALLAPGSHRPRRLARARPGPRRPGVLRRRRRRSCATGSPSASRRSVHAAPVRVGLRRRRRARARRASWPASPASASRSPSPSSCRSWACSPSSPASAARASSNALALSHAYRGTALLMSDLLEADDAYTGGEHSHGVVALALAVGDALGLEARDRRNLEFAALLHDIGKIRVPDAIINKPGKLTDEEFELVKRHPVDGQEMLERVGGVLAEVGHHRPPPPRALGRPRLPRRHRGRGDPARRAHHLRLRRLQRDDHQPRLPGGAAESADAVAELERCSGDAVRPGRGRRAAARPWPSTPSTARRGRCSSSLRSRTAPRTIRSQPKAAAESGR